MKAYRYLSYGGPEKLELFDTKIPEPKADEVLVHNEYISINPSELYKLNAGFWLIRLSTGILKPNRQVLGADFAGTVVGLGRDVTHLKVGDRVMGRHLYDCLAEYSCGSSTTLAKIPSAIPTRQAASLPLAAITALVALRDKGALLPKQKVLINGASGGIGTLAIQIARYFGAEVTGICSADNISLVRSLGAQHVIDYNKTSLKDVDTTFDLIIDLIGNHKVEKWKRLLNSGGRCVLVGMHTPGLLFRNILVGGLVSISKRKKIVTMNTSITTNDLDFISGLVDRGHLRPVIEKVFSFDELPSAFRHLATKRTKGKIVISIDESYA